MKRALFTIILLLSAFYVHSQVSGTVNTLGYAQGQKTVEQNGQKIVIGISGVGFLGTQNKTIAPTTATSDEVVAMAGFNNLLAYFPQLLDEDFFISKGYFPDYIQLRWNLERDTESISRFQLFRKPLNTEGDSILIATLAPDIFSYQDETAELGTLYKYTLFAKGVADDLRLEFVNWIQDDGFAFPAGSVSGQINYEGGTAVQSVQVLASTDGRLKGKSVDLDGQNSFLRVIHKADDDELELNQGFTIQLWTKYEGNQKGVLFNKGDDYELDYDGQKLTFSVADATLEMDFVNPVDSFFHVSASYIPNQELKLYALVNETRSSTKTVSAGNTPGVNNSPILFGRNSSGNFYKGKMDEARIWQSALTNEEIDNNFSRYIAGFEDNLSAYWRFDMGLTRDFYDFARRGATFTENHGFLVSANFSDVTPYQSQLAFRGITDKFGNYTITGFPYETNGSLYQFTPLLPHHTFDPGQQIRFVGPGSAIHNEVNFTDNSSFQVSGTVKYKDSPFPVEGVSILIDGQPAIDSEGRLILTDNLGRFTVDVPIGEHSIRVNMPNHTFEDEGRFPKPVDGTLPLFDFQEPINGLEFVDNTLIKVAGRVVGGPIEEGKALGFSLSKNNIGNATITLTTQKGFDITNGEQTKNVTERNAGTEINNTVKLLTRNITIKPDTETGEYVAFLPPEQYRVTSVSAGTNNFDDSFNVTLDLRQSFGGDTESFQDTVAASVNGVPVPGYAPFDESEYEGTEEYLRNDTLFTVAIDTFRYQLRKDFILRNAPTIVVTNLEGGQQFGEPTYTYKDENLGIEETIDLYDEETDTYTFGHPIFQQRAGNTYDFNIELFEEYVNSDNDNAVDRVPVLDGKIEVVNELSFSSNKIVLPLDKNGKTRYSFNAGYPNRSLDANNADNSFTKTLNITAVSGNDGAIKTVWRESDPFRGIVFGSQPIGNNFVTAGPNVVDYILRDPPGSNSSTSLTKGETIAVSRSFSLTDETSVDNRVNLSLGLGVTTFVGLGAGVINEVDDHASLEAGFNQTQTYTDESTVEEVTTVERTISTSDASVFVGESADVFIGKSTNIVYGAASFLEIIPVADCTLCGDTEVNGYKIGTRSGLNFDAQFNTGFAFTQFYIENILVPELKDVRNTFLTFNANPESVVAQGDDPVYISRLPTSDERYGTNNTNRKVWGSSASEFTNDGPSYRIVFPDDFDGKKSDTIAYYNKQIESWEYWLGENERQKVQAELQENISFESGSAVASSSTFERTESSSFEVDFTIDTDVAVEMGVTINDLGITRSMTMAFSSSNSQAGSNDTTRVTTVEFNLADGDIGDSYTVDVKKPKDGFGPIFSTRGGQTACPYEPEYKTRYFEPGQHTLSAATVRREGPQISVSQSTVSGVPSNRAANFNLILSSDSESGEGFFYDLFVDPVSNPNGAILEINGTPIGNGLSYLVKGTESLNQTLTVRQGQDDIYDYENIRLILKSQCQFDPTEPQADIADTVAISTFFVPGCSDIRISDPGENWVVNTNNAKPDTLLVSIDNYDLNYVNFRRMQFQYRPAGTADFTTDMTFYNALQVSNSEFEEADEPKMLISDPSILYAFDMSSLPDQEYDIRVVAYCDAGPGVVYETPSEVLRGVKDTQRPQLFGAPQPADGILSAGEDVRIKFSEPIVGSLLTTSNFSIQGVLNNSPVRNSVSVDLDGVNDYVRIEDGVNLGNGSFTIEFKLRRNKINEEMTLFSKGFVDDDKLEIGFTADNKLFIDVSGERKTTSVSFSDMVQFNHYTIAYNADEDEYFAYRNDKYILEGVSFTNEFSGIGPIAIGKSTVGSDSFLDGNVLDLRIWDRFKTLPEVFAKISNKLLGSEIGLIGYWPMDEGFGTLAADRARFRNATVFADWLVLPAGYALSFDGEDEYLSINTASTVVISNEMDFTIEFWYNGVSGQRNVVLFSSGRGTNGTEEENIVDDPSKSLSIGINAQGELIVVSNGRTSKLPIDSDDVLDDNWHHFAISVSRIGNANFFFDGVQVLSKPSDNFGGLLRAKMTLGARGYNTGSNTVTFDRFFNGSIDDFRIWGSAKNGTQVSLDRNSRLSGEEIGLLAYYSFDQFVNNAGIQMLEPTLVDQFVNPFGSNGGEARSNGTEFTQSTPNIQLQRPVKSVPYTFVVNNDELIINLSSSINGLIEGSIIEFAISNVEDEFENRLASPITFTALIDRNQVIWGNSSITVEKKSNELHSFQVDIVNLGGSEESFELVNLPLWLTASVERGSIAPNSRLSVEFEVNSGLNVGYYNQDIFLTTDFGFNEKLNLNVNVFKQGPGWEVNPADFEFSMSIVAALNVNGNLSRDENDSIAAYVGNELRGTAQLEYVREFDQFMAFMDIYSNDANESTPIEFRAFDADKGIEYRDLDPINPTFTNNATIGRPSEPQILRTGQLRSEKIRLQNGFSWVSFNLNSSQLDNSNLLLKDINAQNQDRVSGVQGLDFFTPGVGWLGDISNDGGYKLDTYYLFHIQGGGEIDLIGTKVDAGTTIKIGPGFNRIGFIPDFVLTVNEAFSGLEPSSGDIVRGQFAFAVYEEGLGWIGSLNNLNPGQGYLYYSNSSEQRAFSYPRSTFLAENRAPQPINDDLSDRPVYYEYNNPWKINPHDFGFNMSMIASLKVDNPEEFVIAAFDSEGLIGLAEPMDHHGEPTFFLTIYGDNSPKDVIFKAFSLRTGQTFNVNESINYQTNTLLGNLNESYDLNIGQIEARPIVKAIAYPNPFSSTVEIDLGGEYSNVRMEVLSLDGRILKDAVFGEKQPIRVLEWNGRNHTNTPVAQGAYLIRVDLGVRVETLKVIKR